MTTIDSINIYKLELKLEKYNLLAKKMDSEVNDKIREIDANAAIYSATKAEEFKEKKEKLNKELTKLRFTREVLDRKIKALKIKIKALKTDDSLKDDEIALVNDSDSIDGKYNIYSFNFDETVGYISFCPKYFDTDTGSIGYEIYKRYRGNNYAYRSLKMLSNYLSEQGVEKLSIVAEESNKESIHIMEKFREDVKETINKSDKHNSIRKYAYSIK